MFNFNLKQFSTLQAIRRININHLAKLQLCTSLVFICLSLILCITRLTVDPLACSAVTIVNQSGEIKDVNMRCLSSYRMDENTTTGEIYASNFYDLHWILFLLAIIYATIALFKDLRSPKLSYSMNLRSLFFKKLDKNDSELIKKIVNSMKSITKNRTVLAQFYFYLFVSLIFNLIQVLAFNILLNGNFIFGILQLIIGNNSAFDYSKIQCTINEHTYFDGLKTNQTDCNLRLNWLFMTTYLIVYLIYAFLNIIIYICFFNLISYHCSSTKRLERIKQLLNELKDQNLDEKIYDCFSLTDFFIIIESLALKCKKDDFLTIMQELINAYSFLSNKRGDGGSIGNCDESLDEKKSEKKSYSNLKMETGSLNGIKLIKFSEYEY